LLSVCPFCNQSRRSRTLARERTPPEVSRPSGDITAGVRYTRDFHSRHLPPMSFLRTSTDYSSRRLACPVSYRHHLWDSKNTRGHCLSCGPDRTILGTALFGITKTRTCQQPESYQLRKSCRDPTRASHYLSRTFPGKHCVDVSLTEPPASRPNERRAHRHARPSRLELYHVTRSLRRRVTHRTACKQTEREEGTSTCPSI